MDDLQHKRLLEGADFFNGILRKVATNEQGIHADTLIASAARMAGTMLFRSFVPPGSNFEPGTTVLSEQANVSGPKLMNLMFVTLKSLGDPAGEDLVDRDALNTKTSQLSLRQVQEQLDPFFLAYCKAAPLSFEEAAFSLAIATGILVHDCKPALEISKGSAIAIYGFIEGAKTAPIAMTPSHKAPPAMPSQVEKKPWYKVW
jgi:hypothetical protein